MADEKLPPSYETAQGYGPGPTANYPSEPVYPPQPGYPQYPPPGYGAPQGPYPVGPEYPPGSPPPAYPAQPGFPQQPGFLQQQGYPQQPGYNIPPGQDYPTKGTTRPGDVPQRQFVLVERPAPPNYLMLSCFVLWCCCIPIGLIAVFFSYSATSAASQGKYEKAIAKGKAAKAVSIAGIVLGIIFTIVFVILRLYIIKQHQHREDTWP